MPILEPHHDLAHPVEDDRSWSESYYFNAFDPDSDAGLFTRIGIRPNEGTMDVGMSVWLPGGELAEYREVVEQHEMIDTMLDVGAVRYEMLEPTASWRIAMDGDAPVRSLGVDSTGGRSVHLEIELRFDATTPAIGTDGTNGLRPSASRSPAAASAAGTTGKGHLEQAGRCSGWLSIGDQRLEWSGARGMRDKSWGPRRWRGPKMWRWFSINVGEDLHLGGIRLATDAGELHRGWVWDAGRATSIRRWDVATELEDDRVTQRVVHLGVEDKAGRTFTLVGTVLRVADIGRGGATLVNEGLASWTCLDPTGATHTGYGICEYLHQLGDDGMPVVAVE